MTTRVRERPATYEDLLKVPDHLVAELIQGELFTSPRPAGPHIRTASALGALLTSAFQFGHGGPGGWWILDEPELHLGDDVLVPDLAGWRVSRMPEIPESHIFDITPDWVCEVTSPSSGRLDRLKKMPVYARNDVPFAWLVEPTLQTIEAFALRNESWVLLGTYGEQPTARVAPFAEVEIDLTLIWGPLPS